MWCSHSQLQYDGRSSKSKLSSNNEIANATWSEPNNLPFLDALFKFFLIIFLLSFSIVKGQNSGIEILRKVMENTLNLENALYNFTIS